MADLLHRDVAGRDLQNRAPRLADEGQYREIMRHEVNVRWEEPGSSPAIGLSPFGAGAVPMAGLHPRSKEGCRICGCEAERTYPGAMLPHDDVPPTPPAMQLHVLLYDEAGG